MFKQLNKISVRFRHDSVKGITESIISIPGREEMIGARARCSVNDNYCKESGRKLSLLRAMQSANINRADRFLEWEQYRLMTKTPRWPATTLDSKRIKRAKKKSIDI